VYNKARKKLKEILDMNLTMFYALIVLSTVITGVSLVYSYRSNKVRLLNGMLLSFLLVQLALLAIAVVSYANNVFLTGISVILFLIIAIPLSLLISWAGILLLVNAFIVMRKESKSLGNRLTLFLGLGIILLPFVLRLVSKIFPDWAAWGIYLEIDVLVGYFIFWLISFVMSFLLYVCLKPKYNQEYIIVLGAGLINGREVAGLLASRINRAIEFADKQKNRGNKLPLLIMSGGQGPDELVPEGEAMRNFAIEHGYPEELVIAEKQSTTTYENMLFSKEIIEARGLSTNQGIFCTSDYHVFRAAGYALQVGLKIDGIGAKTKRYFVYNAFIREYIAILANHKKFHIICLSVLTLGVAVGSVIIGFLSNWQ